jgi:hypothetical protein
MLNTRLNMDSLTNQYLQMNRPLSALTQFLDFVRERFPLYVDGKYRMVWFDIC